jgi:phospholipid transport system substrate-binding protein
MRFSPFPTLVLTGLVLCAPALVAAGQSPEKTIEETAGKVIEVLADDNLSDEEKKAELTSYLDSCCDFETTSKLVLARNWRTFSEAQRAEFVDLFRSYLIATYGDNVKAYNGETVEILGGREEARGDYTVLTKIARGGGNADVLVNYRLRKDTDGNWKILDVIGEGISLVANLRSQFQEVISHSGPEGLLKKLREKSDLDADGSAPPSRDRTAPTDG